MDACPGDHQSDLADSVSDHPDLVWLCVRPSGQRPVATQDSHSICGEPDCESEFHASVIRAEKLTPGHPGYPDRLVDYSLDVPCGLATFPLGGNGTGSLFHLGLDRERAADQYFLVELESLSC